MNHYLKQANEFLKLAEKEFKEGKSKKNLIQVRQAAEKGWNATVQATNGLFAKKGYSVPKSNQKRRDKLERIAPELRPDFDQKAFSLHSRCFYDGVCPLHIIKKDIKEVRDYIKKIEKK
ncbi:MAG: hypothetical protein GH144_02415 [Clostridia bacterium]|jgi:HEPN domain-containing protein|nr:hypothetical protein [Clostridia bacterium]